MTLQKPSRYIIRESLLLLGAFFFCRLFFLIFNWSWYQFLPSTDILLSFLVGFQFDLAVLALINLPLFFLLSFTDGRARKLIYVFFVSANTLALALNILDAELVVFNGRRITPLFFFIFDGQGIFLKVVWDYFWLLASGLSFLGLYIFLSKAPRFPRPLLKSTGSLRWTTAVFLVTYVYIYGLGPLGGLRESKAYAFENLALGNLALNSGFSFLLSQREEVKEPLEWFPVEEAKALLAERLHKKSSFHGSLKGRNVVLIVLESFSLEYMGRPNGREGYTPFLDELSEKSLFFQNAYSNGRRSIDAIPSVLSGIPSFFNEPFLLSKYRGRQIIGLPEVLREASYSTSFFHGTMNGSMFFDWFVGRIGVQSYFGLNEYPFVKRDHDGMWGLWDEPYFQYVVEELNGIDAPFMATLFSLSSHHPYHVPAEYNHLPKGSLEIHQSIAYADQALRKFFASAKEQDWYSNTLFVITADHTSKSDDPSYADMFGPFRVPIMFYAPGFRDWPKVEERRVQHIDIPVTVLDALGRKEALKFPGQSVFSETPDFAVNRHGTGFWLQTAEGWGLIDHQGEVMKKSGLVPSDFEFMRAYVQTQVNRVIEAPEDKTSETLR